MQVVFNYSFWEFWESYNPENSVFGSQKVTFDGENKIIFVNAGIRSIDVKEDLYSDWKEWSLVRDNTKFPQALTAVGGDPITATESVGITYFLENGWRIQPSSEDQILSIRGNLYTREEGGDPYLEVDGNFKVTVNTVRSNIVDQINSGGQGGGDIGAQVWGAQVNDYSGAGTFGEAMISRDVVVSSITGVSGGEWPKGTFNTPVDNMTDALAVAIKRKVNTIKILDDISLIDNLTGYEVIGTSTSVTLNLNGRDVTDCTFKNLRITGTMTGEATFFDCEMVDVSGFAGTAHRCGFDGIITPATGAKANFQLGYTTFEGTPTLNFQNGGPGNLNNTAYSGVVDIINMNDPDLVVAVNFVTGEANLDVSNTDGTITLRGVGTVVDNSAGTTVINEMVSNSSIASRVWDESRTDHIASGTMGAAMNLILADTNQLRLDSISILNLVDTLLKYESNRTRIDKIDKTLTVYDDDGITPIKVFDLLDGTGTPSTTEVCERNPQ